MNHENNGTGGKLPPDQPEQLTEEAEKLIRHALETPIDTDEDLTELGEIYDE